jgi:class 3 adenylate cyclase
MAQDKFKRKLTTVFSADVAGYSRLMGDDESATVKTLEQYKGIMSGLIHQHRGRVGGYAQQDVRALEMKPETSFLTLRRYGVFAFC